MEYVIAFVTLALLLSPVVAWAFMCGNKQRQLIQQGTEKKKAMRQAEEYAFNKLRTMARIPMMLVFALMAIGCLGLVAVWLYYFPHILAVISGFGTNPDTGTNGAMDWLWYVAHPISGLAVYVTPIIVCIWGVIRFFNKFVKVADGQDVAGI